MNAGAVKGSHDSEERPMQTIKTIGLDIAKSVFQVHGVDAAGAVVIRRQLKRRSVLAFFQKLPPCLVGIEACASSHHWSRELQALGHTVRLMPPAYVKPYDKGEKNGVAGAEGILEALPPTNRRFVPPKTPEQESCLMLPPVPCPSASRPRCLIRTELPSPLSALSPRGGEKVSRTCC